jgi:broad specificity phosphatase PhoE
MTSASSPPTPTRVYLLRHAETAAPNVFHGAESDIGLSERGQRQAEAIAPVLAAHRPNAIVSSAMRRAIATATPIAAACGLPLHLESQLHERRVGALTGCAFHEGDVWPQTLRHWMAGETRHAPDGAESFDDIRSRVLPVWHRLTTVWAGRSLVIVAHGVVCKVLLLSLVPGLSVANWQSLGPIKNVALHELFKEGAEWRLLRCNDLPEAVRCLE